MDHNNHNIITTMDQSEWITAIKNNSINVLDLICTTKHREMDKYKGILEALKMNTSILSLDVTINYTKLFEKYEEYDEWSCILSDVFKINTTITHITLSINNITNTGFKLLCEGLSINRSINQITIVFYNNITTCNSILLSNMIKTNSYLSNIHINCSNIDKDGWTNIINSLKVNKTLIRVGLYIRNTNFNGSPQLNELLLVNKTIATLDLNTHGMLKYEDIIYGLKKNPSVKQLYDSSCMRLPNIAYKLDKYLSRNVHNSKLKGMMLQDITSPYKKSNSKSRKNNFSNSNSRQKHELSMSI
jgi:hypothetical protein